LSVSSFLQIAAASAIIHTLSLCSISISPPPMAANGHLAATWVPLVSRGAAWISLIQLLSALIVLFFAREHISFARIWYLGAAAVGLIGISEVLPLTAVLASCALCYRIFVDVANPPRRPAPSFEGRIVVITGSSAGIGEEAAAQLLHLGATVVFACRSEARAQAAIARCLKRSGAPPRAAHFVPIDLSDATSVRAFAQRVVADFPVIHILLCNAGGMFQARAFTSHAWEMHLAANAIGHHLLVSLLLPSLRAAPSSRIVTVTSSLHKSNPLTGMDSLISDPMSRRSFSMFDAYSRAKLAQICTSFVVHRREQTDAHAAGRRPVPSVAVHPGNPDTEVTRDFPIILKLPLKLLAPVFPIIKGTLERSAASVVYACHCAEAESEHPIYMERTRAVPPVATVACGLNGADRVVEMMDKLVQPWSAPLER
jgi:NAD(P)-dependent dehydrogenase (short-subunit alcohol dehydrogenase family)